MGARHFTTHFTPEAADRWVPRLRELFARIHAILDSVEDEISVIQEQAHRVGGNGGGFDSRHYFSSDRELGDALREIQSAGILIQDIRRGLVDFPHVREGREVFLCWELADGDRIQWFHELQAGFAGRAALPR
jgi:hypothetical protein